MLRGDRRELKQILERARARANAENIRRGREGNNEEIFSPIPLRGSVDRISIDDSILSPHRSISSPRRISLDSGSLGMPLLRRGTGRGSELLQLSQSSPANQDQTPQYFGSLLSDISNSGRLSSSFSPPNSPIIMSPLSSSDGEGPRRKKRNKRKGKQTTRKKKGKKNKTKKRR